MGARGLLGDGAGELDVIVLLGCGGTERGPLRNVAPWAG